jgi:hypothetical protein
MEKCHKGSKILRFHKGHPIDFEPLPPLKGRAGVGLPGKRRKDYPSNINDL